MGESSLLVADYKALCSFYYRPSAFDNRTRSARELLRQVDSERFHRCNPKLKVNANIEARYDAPKVTFAFVDGSDVSFDSREYLVNEMMMDVWRKTMKMDDDFEL